MSGYAGAAAALGAAVTGSDAADSPYAAALAADGVLHASIGHSATNVPSSADVEVVYSSAVPEENPERVSARERGLPERPRSALLAELSALRRTIAVAGTHGKTTTSSMLVHVLRAAGLEPSWLIGGVAAAGLENACWAESEWLVVEADESDRSMLSLSVEIAVLTNVELDPHATYASLADVREAFREFLALARRGIVMWARGDLLELAPSPAPELVTFDVCDPELGPDGVRMHWRGEEVALAVHGAHNALDALAALEAARLAGADAGRAARSLATFAGAGRRFELLGTSGGARVYDDYAHHPSEVAATLDAARTLAPQRLLAVFQPHLYSRTAALAGDFGRALARADVIAVVGIYGARERSEDHPGVSALRVAQAAADAAPGRPVYWLPALEHAEAMLRAQLREGDVCVVMGAGDVDQLARALVEPAPSASRASGAQAPQ
jgi:UDP-N-acetylmuramate--alanine ligase